MYDLTYIRYTVICIPSIQTVDIYIYCTCALQDEFHFSFDINVDLLEKHTQNEYNYIHVVLHEFVLLKLLSNMWNSNNDHWKLL